MYLRTRQSAKTARFTAIGDWCAACALDDGSRDVAVPVRLKGIRI
jgi:hypothetical protein